MRNRIAAVAAVLVLIAAYASLVSHQGFAATTTGKITNTAPYFFDIDTTAVAVSGDTTLGTLLLSQRQSQVWLYVCNSDPAGTVDNFEVDVQVNPNSDWIDGYISGTDFDTATADMRAASATGPHEIGTNGCAWARLNVGNPYAIRLQASAATSTAQVNVHGAIGGSQD